MTPAISGYISRVFQPKGVGGSRGRASQQACCCPQWVTETEDARPGRDLGLSLELLRAQAVSFPSPAFGFPTD